jgi:hypothetical protein
MNALPGQLELATVIDHQIYPANVMDVPAAWMLEGMVGGNELTFQQCDLQEEQNRYGGEFVALYRQQDTHKPSGVRLAKMLSQYDDSPSSQLWSDIQRLAREILK